MGCNIVKAMGLHGMRCGNTKTKMKKTMAITISAVIIGVFSNCNVNPPRNSNDRYFLIQNHSILASMDYEFHSRLFDSHPRHDSAPLERPQYLIDAFFRLPVVTEIGFAKEPRRSISEALSDKFGVELRYTDWRLEAFDKHTGENLNIYGRKDWETIHALVSDCNRLMESEGRLACEFDGGSDYGMKPYTTILFNVTYLKYQEQTLGYKDGRYILVDRDEPNIVLDADALLLRNAIARGICYELLARISSMLQKNFEETGQKLSADERGWSSLLTYKDLNKYYIEKLGQWDGFAKQACKTELTFSETGFEAKNTETGEKIAFPRDNDLLNEALKELNYYKEKCDFVNYFQIENYPMFLLSILRLYDVNLELDKATNKYVLAPGPTDPERFFKIVAEFTFVNDPSDTEYLREHLTGWLTPEDKEPSIEQK